MSDLLTTDDTCTYEEVIVFKASCVGSEDDDLGEALHQAFGRFCNEVSDAGYDFDFDYYQ